MKNKGLIERYIVLKTEGEGKPDIIRRGTPGDFFSRGRSGWKGWSKRTWSFVLSPEKDDAYGVASRWAMLEYAKEIEGVNPQLAKDMRSKVTEIRYKLLEERGIKPK